MAHTGIFPNTFLQPVNSSKSSILNWVMKLNLLMCFCFFLFLKHPWKIFHSILLFFLFFGLNTIERHIKESYINLSSQLFFKTPHRTLKFQENPKKMHFPAIWRPKFKKFSLQCLPCWVGKGWSYGRLNSTGHFLLFLFIGNIWKWSL